MKSIREQFLSKLQDKEYRDAFVAEQVFSGLPLKIACLRERRQLSQRQLGERMGVAQAWVAKLEDPNYGKLTLSTLLRLAAAFDVGLEVDFVPLSRVLDKALGLSPDSFEVASFAADKALSRRNQVSPARNTVVTSRRAQPGYSSLAARGRTRAANPPARR